MQHQILTTIFHLELHTFKPCFLRRIFFKKINNNNHRVLYAVLTIKIGDDQHFNYRWPYIWISSRPYHHLDQCLKQICLKTENIFVVLCFLYGKTLLEWSIY